MDLRIVELESRYKKLNIPPFRPGDFVRVMVKVVEGESERLQSFEGVVLRRRGSGTSATFSVRKVSFSIGIERTFALYSPRIQEIKVIRSGKVRRARLYYLRKLSGRAARIEERKDKLSADSARKTASPSGISV